LIGEDGEEGSGYAEFTPNASVMQQEQEREDQEVEMLLNKLREREKRTVIRKIEAGEIAYSMVKKAFIYIETEEEYKIEGSDDDDEEDSDDSEDS
jgi:hypothetical protein